MHVHPQRLKVGHDSSDQPMESMRVVHPNWHHVALQFLDLEMVQARSYSLAFDLWKNWKSQVLDLDMVQDLHLVFDLWKNWIWCTSIFGDGHVLDSYPWSKAHVEVN